MTDITLDDILTVLDEHYNSVKALDALNQELFQLQIGEKETVLEWGGASVKAPPNSHWPSFPECFPPYHIAELKQDHFYRGLPKLA